MFSPLNACGCTEPILGMSSRQQARGKAPPQPLTCPPVFLPQCYKSSKDHSPQLDVNLLGCTVIHKEKQVRKKEHKLKIIPTNADVIVLGLQSKDQAEQWLRVSGAFGACPAGAPVLLPWLCRETVSYLSPVLVCSGSLRHCKPVYKYTALFSCPRIAPSRSSLTPSARRRPWRDLPAPLLRQEGRLGWVPNANWLRTGRYGPFPETAAEEGAFAEPGSGAARRRGCLCWQPLPG